MLFEPFRLGVAINVIVNVDTSGCLLTPITHKTVLDSLRTGRFDCLMPEFERSTALRTNQFNYQIGNNRHNRVNKNGRTTNKISTKYQVGVENGNSGVYRLTLDHSVLLAGVCVQEGNEWSKGLWSAHR